MFNSFIYLLIIYVLYYYIFKPEKTVLLINVTFYI